MWYSVHVYDIHDILFWIEPGSIISETCTANTDIYFIE